MSDDPKLREAVDRTIRAELSKNDHDLYFDDDDGLSDDAIVDGSVHMPSLATAALAAIRAAGYEVRRVEDWTK